MTKEEQELFFSDRRGYRLPTEIKRDIHGVKEKIADIYEGLNFRYVIDRILTDSVYTDTIIQRRQLAELISEAEEAVCGIVRLKETLDELLVELEVSLWATAT